MATFSKRPTGNWQVQVRKRGFPTQSRVFATKREAQTWAFEVEAKMVQGGFVAASKDVTLDELLMRYRDEVSSQKKGGDIEQIRINRIRSSEGWLTSLPVCKVASASIASYRDKRLKEVSPPTVKRELELLRNVFNVAAKEWRVCGRDNPVSQITLPEGSRGRTRLLDEKEWGALVDACGKSRNKLLLPAVIFARYTAMRQGEILSLRWENVSLEEAWAHLPDTKNGHSRTIPLVSAARDVLATLGKVDALVFPMTKEAVKSGFKRATTRAGLSDLHFHDLRHCAITDFAEKLHNVLDIAAISGHRDIRMLNRYTHPRTKHLLKKLEAAT